MLDQNAKPQTQGPSTQTLTTQDSPAELPKAVTMADLERLRDRAAAERLPSNIAASIGSIASTFASTTRRSTLKSVSQMTLGEETVPAGIKAIRAAVKGLQPMPSHKQFNAVARECVEALASQLGERYSPGRATLGAFAIYDSTGAQAEVLACVSSFVKDLEAVLRESRGLVLFGPSGTGKDHLLAAALYEVARAGIPASFVSGEEIYLRVRDSMDTGEREEHILRRWTEPLVLGISDPISPTGELKEWDSRMLARLLDRRYRAMRPTWLTMNAKSEADAADKLTAMIWDRFRDNAEMVPCFWASYRGLRNRPNNAIAGKVNKKAV